MGRTLPWVLLAAALIALAIAGTAGAGGGTSRVNLAHDGDQAEAEESNGAAISPNGAVFGWSSAASNLVSGDTNSRADVFVRTGGSTERVSLDDDEGQGAGSSFAPALSSDGSVVAFESLAEDLVGDDDNEASDVFVRNRSAGTTQRVSVSSGEDEANAASQAAAISETGRYVAFESVASNLVGNDGNGAIDVFVRDRSDGETEAVSVAGGGGPGGGSAPSISGNGRYVAFESGGALVPEDTNNAPDVYVRDRSDDKTIRVSVPEGGGQAAGASRDPSISASGRYVAFESDAANLVAGDTNNAPDVFVRDLETGETRRVSLTNGGGEGDKGAVEPAISDDGRVIAFRSDSTDLVGDDRNDLSDVFVRDRERRTTTRVSVSDGGGDSNGDSYHPAVDEDGSRVLFESSAQNLVSGDTNGVRDVFMRELPGAPPRSPEPPSAPPPSDDGGGATTAVRGDQPSTARRGLGIAFVRDGDVWIVRATGAGLRRLTQTAARESEPTLSTGGGVVYFTRGGDIFRVAARGGRARAVMRSRARESGLAIGPRGRVVFARGGDLFSTGPAGGPSRRITRSAAPESQPAVSPGGRVAFVRGGNVLVTSLRAARSRALTRTRARESGPSFSRSGRIVVFSRGGDLFQVPARGGRARRRLAGASSDLRPTFLPDGRIVFARAGAGGPQLWLLRGTAVPIPAL